MRRIARLRAAIGDDHAPSIDPEAHILSIVRQLEPQRAGFCSECLVRRLDPFERWCVCGAPTWSNYDLPGRRAAPVPPGQENLQIAERP